MRLVGIVAVIAFAFGVLVGWQWKTTRVNSATVKQVVKATKVEAKNEVAVEKQNDNDQIRIRQLEDQLAAARRDAAARGVPKPPQQRCVPATQADAGAGGTASADQESARRYEEAYRAFRDELIVAGAVAEQLRLQVLSCQAQWPGR